jgi:hypothetical protein
MLTDIQLATLIRQTKVYPGQTNRGTEQQPDTN